MPSSILEPGHCRGFLLFLHTSWSKSVSPSLPCFEYMLMPFFPRSTPLPFDLRVATRVDQRQRTFKHETRTSLHSGPKFSLALCYSSADVTNATTSWHLTSAGVGDSDRLWLDPTPLVLRPQSRIYSNTNLNISQTEPSSCPPPASSEMTGDGVVLPNICGGLGGHWFHYGR